MKCLVTGAGGFIGQHLVRHLLASGHQTRAASSHLWDSSIPGLEQARIKRCAVDPADWQAVCQGIDTVFHLAGRAHHASDASATAQTAYFQDNLEMTRAVAEAALGAGVRRFVFVSSSTVYGAASAKGAAFLENSPTLPHPEDVYAQSKLAAEAFLLSNDAGARMETTVVRLPLVYGAGVKGNMAALMRLARRGWPLPLASIDNRRSFIGIANCVDFLLSAACHPRANGRILLASDREDISAPDLIRLLAASQKKSARLFSMPPPFLRTVCALVGKKARFDKLTCNFQIDPAASCALLGWSPKVGLAEGIAQMCRAVTI